MIAQAEASLLAIIAPLKKVLRAVDVLPNLEPDALIKQLAPEAPAIYVDFIGVDFPASAVRETTLRFELLLLARNARSPMAARQGDARTIGLHDMLDHALRLVAGNPRAGFTWYAKQALTSKAAVFTANGIAAASILCTTAAELDDAIGTAELDALAQFETFHADYDLPPFAGPVEHAHWLQEPPNHETAVPPLSDQLNLAGDA